MEVAQRDIFSFLVYIVKDKRLLDLLERAIQLN